MAHFSTSEAQKSNISPPCAVSRARLHIARNEREKCAISATLSVPPFGYTHVDLRWPWGGVLGVGVVTRHAARCRAGARETSKFARSCTPRSATERVGLSGYVAATGPVRVRDKHNAPRGAAGTHAHAPAPRLKNRRPSGPKTHFYLKIFRRRPLLNHKTSRRSCS